jgi:hypothetical protein
MGGCLAQLNAAGAGVKLSKAEPVTGCRELGIVHGSGGGAAYTSSEDKMQSAQNDIRNRAATMGGNYVVMDVMGGDISGLTLSGRAFQCPPEPLGATGPMVAAAPAPDAQAQVLAPHPQAAQALREARPAPQPTSAEERLVRLKELLDKGLITQPEYDGRRKEILQSL